jgi:energy-coupling factor transporter ATP-binding protein EcfA2
MTVAHANAVVASNPFATRFTRPGQLPFLFTDQVESELANDDAMRQLAANLIRQRRGLIVGPHGTGKSTLLHSLLPHLTGAFSSILSVHLTRGESAKWVHRWHHQREINRHLRDCRRSAKSRSLLLLDGAEQVTTWQRARLLRWSHAREVSILATSHRSLRGLPVLYRTCLNATLISRLTSRLLQNTSAEVHSLVGSQLDRHDLNAVSNLRELWFELYDVVQPALLPSSVLQSQRPASVDQHRVIGR